MDIGQTYQRFYAAVCGQHPNQRPWHFQWLAVVYLHRRYRTLMPMLRGRLLDVGCGAAPYRQWLTGIDEYLGLDVVDAPGVDIVVADEQSWPIADQSFDVVFSSQVIEHVQDLNFVLAEIDRVLKPGGRVLLAFPFLYNEHGAPADYRRYTKHAAGHFLPGYNIEQVEALGGIGSTLGQLFLNWLDRIATRNRILRFSRGVLVPLWIAISALLNALGRGLDGLDGTSAFYNNTIVLLRKTGPSGS